MDRVLLWNSYVVPQFTYGFERYARWDRFSRPDPLPNYGNDRLSYPWWYDAAKAAKTATLLSRPHGRYSPVAAACARAWPRSPVGCRGCGVAAATR